MPRGGKSKQSKKSSEFNQLDFNGLSWDSLIDDSAPPEPERPSSATSKLDIDSPKNPFNFPSTTSRINYDEPLAEWEKVALKTPLSDIEKQGRAYWERELKKSLDELTKKSQSTTTTPAVEVQRDSNGRYSAKPISWTTSDLSNEGF